MTENQKTLTLDEVMCPICLDILIEPVTMACTHELCKECYMEHFKTCVFSCPMCKRRLSTWARKAIIEGTLVNQKKWETIQKEYPDLITSRRNGVSNQIFVERYSGVLEIAKPGELQKEYLNLRQKWLNEQCLQRREEEEASLRLIKQITEEEEAELDRRRKTQLEKDEKLARQISEDLKMDVSPSRVNRVILRPRKVLLPICQNTPSTSGTGKKFVPSKAKVSSLRKRKRESLGS